MSLVDRLPTPQARALRVAFGMQEGERVEPFMVGLATLALMAEAAVLAHARQTGAGFLVVYGLQRIAFAHLLAGQWQALRTDADEALSLCPVVGERGLTAAPLAWLALLAALQDGRLPGAPVTT